MSVNQVQMDQLTLSETVNLLKSVPAGTVRLGIRKPLVMVTSWHVVPGSRSLTRDVLV